MSPIHEDSTTTIMPRQTVGAQNGKHFDWPLAYEAESFLRERIAEFLGKNSFARNLSEQMRDETGTDFFEWVDHLVVSPDFESTLKQLSFVRENMNTSHGDVAMGHPRATLPRVLLRAGSKNVSVIALRPEFVADFVARHNLRAQIEGEPFSQYRHVFVAEENGTTLEAVERRAYRGVVSEPLRGDELRKIIRAKELFRTRPRDLAGDTEAFAVANKILDESIALVGRDMSCQFFFEEERAYWESRNRAGRIQKLRQDKLGLGWGNHDHHTFRCSREHFVDLVNYLLRLGFEKRERYYAGAEAGWGAQISEQAVVGITVFADVDLMPEETELDFSVNRLPSARKLGTVGLWTGLHGESFLQAGMHHLEARFEFDNLRDQLKEQGVNTMKPFSDFQFLRQAFTEGERWPVIRGRAEKLLAENFITREQFEQFVKDGAIGSHLENLQRRGGFKGFNQKAVSVIISATDPRKQHFKEPVAA